MHYYRCTHCEPTAKKRLLYSRLDGKEDRVVYKCPNCNKEFSFSPDFPTPHKCKVKHG